MAEDNTAKEQRDRLRRNESKWTKPLMEAGWTAIPSIILSKQHAFGLDAMDVNILMHLAEFWWFKDNLPHPTKKQIAERMGVNVSTVRKRVARMEQEGLIERKERFHPVRGQEGNDYDFSGLIAKATPYAEEEVEAKRIRQQEASARHARKRPALRVVPAQGGGT